MHTCKNSNIFPFILKEKYSILFKGISFYNERGANKYEPFLSDHLCIVIRFLFF